MTDTTLESAVKSTAVETTDLPASNGNMSNMLAVALDNIYDKTDNGDISLIESEIESFNRLCENNAIDKNSYDNDIDTIRKFTYRAMADNMVEEAFAACIDVPGNPGESILRYAHIRDNLFIDNKGIVCVSKDGSFIPAYLSRAAPDLRDEKAKKIQIRVPVKYAVKIEDGAHNIYSGDAKIGRAYPDNPDKKPELYFDDLELITLTSDVKDPSQNRESVDLIFQKHDAYKDVPYKGEILGENRRIFSLYDEKTDLANLAFTIIDVDVEAEARAYAIVVKGYDDALLDKALLIAKDKSSMSHDYFVNTFLPEIELRKNKSKLDVASQYT